MSADNKTCTWVRIPDDAEVYAGQYEMTCGNIDWLYERDWDYCPYCGGELIVEEGE